jgi:hypothetical protein
VPKTEPAAIEQSAHRESIELPPDQVVQKLLLVLGERLVSRLAEVQDPRTVRRWASGEHAQRDPSMDQRLRAALMITRMMEERDSREVIQAWFQGLNPSLDDRVPLTVLLDDQDPERSQARVLVAARAFIAH